MHDILSVHGFLVKNVAQSVSERSTAILKWYLSRAEMLSVPTKRELMPIVCNKLGVTQERVLKTKGLEKEICTVMGIFQKYSENGCLRVLLGGSMNSLGTGRECMNSLGNGCGYDLIVCRGPGPQPAPSPLTTCEVLNVRTMIVSTRTGPSSPKIFRSKFSFSI
jgi:hypothetical protein